MRTLFWPAAIASCIVFLGGCSTRGPVGYEATSEEHVVVWLHEAPRTLALKVRTDLPEPSFRYSGTAEAGGAGGMGGCIVNPIACAVVLPIAALTGAATSSAPQHRVAFSEVREAAELWRDVRAHEVAAHLERAVKTAAPAHKTSLRPRQADESPVDTLEFSVWRVDFVVPGPEDIRGLDPSGALEISILMEVIAAKIGFVRTYSHRTWRYRISEWHRDGARRLHKELALAAEAAAQQALEDLHRVPDRDMIERVARDRKANRSRIGLD